MTSVAQHLHLSRATLHRWTAAVRAGGTAGLLEGSRAPHHSPHRLPAHWGAELTALRRGHPAWGAAKLRPLLRAAHPRARHLPSLRTLERWLQAAQLTVPPPPRSRRGPEVVRPTLTAAQAPNHVWTLDFKGWFRTADGDRCEPLTVRDSASRFILAIRLVPALSDRAVRPILRALFQHHGLPRIIRVDNGAPFAGQGPLSLTTLSVWWCRVGIQVEFTRPGKPQDNGAHEQMHRLLKAETASPPAGNQRAQQRRFDHWRTEYNQRRPHAALAQTTPAQHYRPKGRPWQAPPPSVYAATWLTRCVRNRGGIKLDGRLRFIGRAFAGQTIGLQRVDAEHFAVFLDRLQIGTLYDQDAGGLRPSNYVRKPYPEKP